MSDAKWKERALRYIDDQSQLGSRTEPDEILDAFRAYDDHPRNEAELGRLAFEAVSELLDEGLIVAYGESADKDMTLDIAPRNHEQS